MNEIQKIMTLASIRKFVDENMPKGMYFDVFDIRLPSEDGDYSDYDAIIPLSSMKEKRKLERLFLGIENLKIAIICL